MNQLIYHIHRLLHILSNELFHLRFEILFYYFQVAEVENQTLHIVHDLDCECSPG
jgi:hypothetical protein